MKRARVPTTFRLFDGTVVSLRGLTRVQRRFFSNLFRLVKSGADYDEIVDASGKLGTFGLGGPIRVDGKLQWHPLHKVAGELTVHAGLKQGVLKLTPSQLQQLWSPMAR